MDLAKTTLSLLFLTVTFAACGQQPATTVSAADAEVTSPATTGNDEEPVLNEDESVTKQLSSADVITTTPRDDLSGLQPVVVSDLFSTDETTIVALFSGGAEPCHGFTATVFEEGDVVEVLVETGAPPEAATATCINQMFDYEMQVQLPSPLGERALEVHPDSWADGEDGAAVVESRDDLLNLRAVTIDRLAVADDDTTVKVWFIGGVPECYGARGTLTESDDVVEVLLEVGNPPDGADACNDIGIGSVMQLTLSEPLGSRSLVAHPDSSDGPSTAGGSEAEGVIGMTVDEAEAGLADAGMVLRIFWVDGEDQILTEDYREDRVNVAVEDGKIIESYIG